MPDLPDAAVCIAEKPLHLGESDVQYVFMNRLPRNLPKAQIEQTARDAAVLDYVARPYPGTGMCGNVFPGFFDKQSRRRDRGG